MNVNEVLFKQCICPYIDAPVAPVLPVGPVAPSTPVAPVLPVGEQRLGKLFYK